MLRFLSTFVIVCAVCILVTYQCPTQCSCSPANGANCVNSSLTEIPQLGFKVQLSKLNASFNNITRLGNESFQHLPNLMHLNLSFNLISDIDPHTFKTLKFLKYLDLSHNYIISINPDLFIYNKKLEWFSIAGNFKFEFPDEGQLQLPQLLFWNLSQCGIINISLDTFGKTTELQELYLDNNEIYTLSQGIFNSLSQLRKLDLSHNFLEEIDIEIFRPLSKLTSISLRENSISKIDISFLDFALSISEFSIEGNPWICDCGMFEAYEICAEEKCDLNVTCEYPDDLRGRSWHAIQELGCRPESTIAVDIEEDVVHETTTALVLQVEEAEQKVWHYVTIGLGAACLLTFVIIVVLSVMICRSRSRYTDEIQQTTEDSSDDGGFNEEATQNIELSYMQNRHSVHE